MMYTSAIGRLAVMPEVFTGGDLTTLFGWKSAIASSYLANWRKSGLVRSLGGRSDVHMNLIRNRQVNPEAALRRAFPNAVKVGVDVLREAGWTTQIPTMPEVAVPTASARYAVQDFELTTRTNKWFLLVAPGIQAVEQGINQLKPAWALADMLARALDSRIKKAWLLDPDDIDLASARRTRKQSDRCSLSRLQWMTSVIRNTGKSMKLGKHAKLQTQIFRLKTAATQAVTRPEDAPPFSVWGG